MNTAVAWRARFPGAAVVREPTAAMPEPVPRAFDPPQLRHAFGRLLVNVLALDPVAVLRRLPTP